MRYVLCKIVNLQHNIHNIMSFHVHHIALLRLHFFIVYLDKYLAHRYAAGWVNHICGLGNGKHGYLDSKFH